MARGMGSRGGSAGIVTGIVRWTMRLAAAVVLLFLGLTALWAVAPPVSTLMLGRWIAFEPVDRRYVSLDRISPRLVAAVVSSEDARFCDHGGVDWDALREVIADAEDGSPSRGASTITMQVAKNLFLWPSRSYVRKALEIPLAVWLDLVWSKRRVMEVYLNIAEWGPGVFGAEAGARAAFGKGADALTAREAALMATALPNPIRRRPGQAARGHQRLAAVILGRMAAADGIARCVLR